MSSLQTLIKRAKILKVEYKHEEGVHTFLQPFDDKTAILYTDDGLKWMFMIEAPNGEPVTNSPLVSVGASATYAQDAWKQYQRPVLLRVLALIRGNVNVTLAHSDEFGGSSRVAYLTLCGVSPKGLDVWASRRELFILEDRRIMARGGLQGVGNRMDQAKLVVSGRISHFWDNPQKPMESFYLNTHNSIRLRSMKIISRQMFLANEKVTTR